MTGLDETSGAPGAAVPDDFQAELSDAVALLGFALGAGHTVPDALIEQIRDAERMRGRGTPPSPEERSAFDRAYRDLARSLAPVTAQTLRDTSDEQGRAVAVLTWGRSRSEAKIWSRKLWTLTIAFVLLLLLGSNLDTLLHDFLPADEETSVGARRWYMINAVMQSFVPFLYGGLGALTYLLRSCHEYIYKRQFDRNRIPEYFNRLLLGIVSGGAILLFVQQIQSDSGTIEISGAALAFLAGYNTDFLFTTIERVIAAILPKVGLDTVQRARPVAGAPGLAPEAGAVSLEDLLREHARSPTAAAKKAARARIDQFVELRLGGRQCASDSGDDG